MQVEFDLTNKIENNVHKLISRRYIVDFETIDTGFTPTGQAALNSFNLLWRGKSDISYADFPSTIIKNKRNEKEFFIQFNRD